MLKIGMSGFMTVLMLFAALVGLGFAVADNRSLRQTVTELQTELANAQIRLTEIETELAAARLSLETATERIAYWQHRSAQLEQDLRVCRDAKPTVASDLIVSGGVGADSRLLGTTLLSAMTGALFALAMTRWWVRRDLAIDRPHRAPGER